MVTTRKPTKLTAEQSEFLKHHSIDEDEIFDANGMQPRQYNTAAKESNCRVIVGANPCKKNGHTLRSPYGQCVQCYPSVLGFHAHFRLPGEVYIAHSEIANLVKVGSAKDAGSRIKSLNTHGYGSASDWTLEWRLFVDQAGFIEHQIHCELREFSVSESFYRGDKLTNCNELFSCSVDAAIDALGKALAADQSDQSTKKATHSKKAAAKAPAKKRTVNAAFMKALTPSAALAAIVGATPLPRTEVVSKLWAYIKKNKLQDAVNKRMINADKKLLKLFGTPQLSMFEMAGLIGKHLS